MTVRAPSLFRPKQAIDQSVLEENRKLVARTAAGSCAGRSASEH